MMTLNAKSAGTGRSRQYLKELGGAMLAYAVVLLASISWLNRHADLASPWRDLAALSPMLPAVAVLWAIMRQMRRLDELQRRVQFEALAFAFAGTALLSFGYGFLEGLGYPRLSMFAVWGAMAPLWVLGLLIAVRRYR